jgi:hypothetical protein
MAAYAQNITAAILEEAILLMSNTIDRKVFKDLIDLIITEYAAMATAGLAGYTLTTGLQATMLQRLDNLNDNIKVEIMTDVIGIIIVEFTAVQSGGLGYTITSGFLVSLKLAVQNYCNVIDRISLHEFFADIQAEQVLLAAAV